MTSIQLAQESIDGDQQLASITEMEDDVLDFEYDYDDNGQKVPVDLHDIGYW